MSGAGDEWLRADHDRETTTGAILFDDYLAARERYFEALRRDSEIRRLERAWDAEPREAAGEG